MHLRKEDTLRSVVGGSLALALATGTFAWGMRLGPASQHGHDLYRAQVPPAQSQPLAISMHRPITLTASRSGSALASTALPQRVAANAPDGDDALTGDSPAATFGQIYLLLKRHYVEGVPDDSKLSHGAAAAMIASLQDPNSRFLEPAQFAELQREAQGRFGGISVVLDVRTHVTPKATDDPTRDKDHPANISYELTVVNVLPGGPAEKAGLQIGDVISDIDGQWIATYDLVSAQAKALKLAQQKNDPVALNKIIDTLQKKLDTALTLAQAQDKLRAASAKPLSLTVLRSGQASPLTLSVQPVAETPLAAVAGKVLTGGIGYIKVSQFRAGTGDAFGKALASLGNDTKGLILDLRGSSGASLTDAAAVAARISTVNILGYRQTKGDRIAAIPVTSAKEVTGPIVVLVNAGTDNAAEVLAAALRSGGAKLVGSTTFGDSADVRPVALRDGSGFTMNVGRLETASKMDFSGTGIKPDVTVADTPGVDSPLNRAVSEISGRMAQLPLESR